MATKLDYWKLRESFYKCRNFEINHLWQKSVFLTAFLVLIFTVYAGIVPKLFDENVNNNKIIIHEICSVLSICGIVFSLIWIMMAKGSKAWYELYETAISKIEREKKIEIPNDYAMGNLYGDQSIDNNIFSNKGGAYSPSKLNIVIGRVFLIIWTTIYIIHMIFELFWLTDAIKNKICPCAHCILLILIFILCVLIFLTSIFNTWGRSSFLSKQ